MLAVFWSDTVGLAFTFVILMPLIATACIIVGIVAARGEKRADEQVRGRWGRDAERSDDG